jgi:hypothetical protein
VVGYWLGQNTVKRLRRGGVIKQDDDGGKKFDDWAVKHRAWGVLLAAVVFSLLAWWLAVKYDGATAGEIALYSLILVPCGIIYTLVKLARIKREK